MGLTMKFNMIGLEENYGKHRFSNNSILGEIYKATEPSSSLFFVWWIEKIFLSGKFEREADLLCEQDWFGVMHVPLLTPNWALYSQNNLSKLYFMDKWQSALKKCKGIVVLSYHMKEQLEALYPSLNIFNLKHPIPANGPKFDFNSFKKDPKLLLVGTWLRNFDAFYDSETWLRKKLIVNHYSRNFIEKQYEKYRPKMMSDLERIDHVEFLDDKNYDLLVCSSVLYLCLHETSANNAICECISYATPFVSKPHPAVIEYCGENYPLLIEDERKIQFSLDEIYDAHLYLKEQTHLREELAIDKFVQGIKNIYANLG